MDTMTRRPPGGRVGRLAAVAGGGWLAWRGMHRADATGAALAMAGTGLLLLGAARPVAQSMRYPVARHPEEAAQALDRPDVLTERFSVTIVRPRPELFAVWRDMERLGSLLPEIVERIEQHEDHVHWRIRIAGRSVTGETRITEELPDRLIAWDSVVDGRIPESGRLIFADAPADRGTEVTLVVNWVPPAGRVGAALARTTGLEPGQLTRRALRRFKQVSETGGLVTAEGQPHGRRRFGRLTA